MSFLTSSTRPQMSSAAEFSRQRAKSRPALLCLTWKRTHPPATNSFFADLSLRQDHVAQSYNDAFSCFSAAYWRRWKWLSLGTLELISAARSTELLFLGFLLPFSLSLFLSLFSPYFGTLETPFNSFKTLTLFFFIFFFNNGSQCSVWAHSALAHSVLCMSDAIYEMCHTVWCYTYIIGVRQALPLVKVLTLVFLVESLTTEKTTLNVCISITSNW